MSGGYLNGAREGRRELELTYGGIYIRVSRVPTDKTGGANGRKTCIYGPVREERR